MNDLPWTGERLVTSVDSIHGVIEHLHRYALAIEIAKNKIVLDIASGEGYGSFLLSKTSQMVFGVDIDKYSILHAQNKYSDIDNLKFLQGSTSLIPLENNSVDIVISFETIEHHDEHELMMKEISRVLRKNGCLLISSPEKSIYKQRDPNNPYHIKELTFLEFQHLLKNYFKYNYYFNQRFVIGSLIHPRKSESFSKFSTFDGNYERIDNELKEHEFYNKVFFNIALCSNVELENDFPYFSFFNGASVVLKEINDLKNRNEYLLNSNSFKLKRFLKSCVRPFYNLIGRNKRN